MVGSKSQPENSVVVLIVEDDSELREILQMELESDGKTVLIAADGKEALNKA